MRKRQRNHQSLRRENIWITRFPFPNDMVRKEMNYAFEPSPDLMFYEIPVADNDDFDV